jgi:hypothetical protein
MVVTSRAHTQKQWELTAAPSARPASSARDLAALGDHHQAHSLHEDTLTRFRRVLGADHPQTRLSADNLAAVMRQLGDAERH